MLIYGIEGGDGLATLNMGNSNIIGISYSDMNKVKSNLKKSQQMLETSQRNVSTARVQLQVDRGRLRVTEDSLSSIYTESSKRKAKIDKMCSNIDYTIRRFKEVDSRCAQRIKAIGNSYNTKTSLFDKIKNVMISLGRYLFGGGTSLLNEGQNAFNNLGSSNSNGYYSFIGRGAGVGNYSAMANSQYSMGGLLLAGTNIYNNKYGTVSCLHEFNFHRNLNNNTEEKPYFKGETYFNQMTEEQKVDWEKWERINREPQPGDAGDGVLGKVYDAYLNSIVYKGLYKLSRFEEQNPEFVALMAMLTFWQSARIDIKTSMPIKETTQSVTNDVSKGVRQPVSVNANEIRFSQNSVNGADEIISSMKENGWKGDPIDVIKMSDGKLTTIDNTRVVAAREAGIDAQVIIHDANELLPENLIDRFTTKKGVPKTWGEAIELRIGKQKASFRNNNPFGSDAIERIGK